MLSVVCDKDALSTLLSDVSGRVHSAIGLLNAFVSQYLHASFYVFVLSMEEGSFLKSLIFLIRNVILS